MAKSSYGSSEESRLSFGVEAQTWAELAELAELAWSASPPGAVAAVLVVIFLSRHCSLLCSPSFLIILSAIYQTKKSKKKRKKNLLFLCILAYVCFFKRKCLCVLSFCAVKELVCRNEAMTFRLFPPLFFLRSRGFFSSFCLERSQSHFSGSCVMYVCLTTLRNLSRTGFKSTTNAGFPISTTDCTYAFCTSGIFYTGD